MLLTMKLQKIALLILPLLTFDMVGGFAEQATVNPWRGSLFLETGYHKAMEVKMFDLTLTKSLPKEEELPLNADGEPDSDVDNYAYSQSGAREIAPFHRLNGGLNRISVGVLLNVLQMDAERQKIQIPRNPLDLVHYYPHLRITELNRKSEHLLRTLGNRVLNFAAYANLEEQGIDPREALTEWIQPLQEYEAHNLTFETEAEYVPHPLRSANNPIRDYIDQAVDDPETAKVLHFFFSTPLVGWQTQKAINFLIGLKNAGKSVTLNTICAIYGTYSMTVPPIYLLPYHEDRLVKELFANQGKRILRIDELNKESSFNEALIKRITGRDGLANPFVTSPLREFTPQVKMFCDSNAPLKPQFGTESSISDRLFYFPYGRVVPLADRDPHFESLLITKENMDTYFSWLIDTFTMDVIRGRLS